MFTFVTLLEIFLFYSSTTISNMKFMSICFFHACAINYWINSIVIILCLFNFKSRYFIVRCIHNWPTTMEPWHSPILCFYVLKQNESFDMLKNELGSSSLVCSQVLFVHVVVPLVCFWILLCGFQVFPMWTFSSSLVCS